jgi:hypothetical protein
MILRLDQVKQLDSLIQRKYVSYFEQAPSDWTKDKFFLDHRPISVTTLYGQNQPIAVHGQEQQEQVNFGRDRLARALRSISFAIASDIRSVIYFITISTHSFKLNGSSILC